MKPFVFRFDIPADESGGINSRTAMLAIVERLDAIVELLSRLVGDEKPST